MRASGVRRCGGRAGLAGSAVTSGSAVEDAASAAPPAAVTKPPETVAKQRRMPSRLDQLRRRAFELLRRHITVPMTARAAAAAATFGGPAASHEKALAKKPTLTLPLRTGAVSWATSEPEACPATNPGSPRVVAAGRREGEAKGSHASRAFFLSC